MNTFHKNLSIVVIGVLILAGLPTLQSEETEEYYEVTRYNMRGLTYDKETIQVSYDDAIAIKDAFDSIDSSLEDAKYKAEWKREILVEYGLLSEEKDFGIFNSLVESVSKIRKKDVQFEDNVDEVFGFFLFLTGTVGPGFNFGSFIIFSPAFGGEFKGANFHGSLGFINLYNFSVVTDRVVNINFYSWVGTLLMFPFFTPFGYLDGFALMGGYAID